MLVIAGNNNSLYYSARALWFEWCWKNNKDTMKTMCIHMFTRGSSYDNGYYDFPANSDILNIKKHIIGMFNDKSIFDNYTSKPPLLTHRQKVFLSYTTEGLSIKDIASQMGITEKTVLAIRSSIMRKIGLKNRYYFSIIESSGNY